MSNKTQYICMVYGNIKAVSPLISAVIVIALSFMIGTLVAPYMFELASNTTTSTGDDIRNTIKCRNMAYDFVTSYGTNGVDWNFTGSETLVQTRIINTGTINAYNFSFEIYYNSSSGLDIKHYDVNATYQSTSSSPLKPGYSTFLKAEIPDDINGTLKEVKILNIVCPDVFVKQEL